MASEEMNDKIKAAVQLDREVLSWPDQKPWPDGKVLPGCSDAQHQAIFELSKRLESLNKPSGK